MLTVEGDRVRFDGRPRDDLRRRLREQRDEILEELRREAAATPNVIQPADGVVRSKSESALSYIPSLGREIWMASDAAEADRLCQELTAEGDDRPVIIADDIVKLGHLPREGLLAALRALCAFPGARAARAERLPDLPEGVKAVFFRRRDGALTLERVIGDPDGPSAEASVEAPVESVQWSGKAFALVTWFERALAAGRLPTEPFQLDTVQHVVNPDPWYRSLEQDIAAGPRAPRAGSVVKELRQLLAIVGPNDNPGANR
jgi:hypothetical protein